MNVLLTIKEQDINPDAPVVDTSGYKQRHAARAVVLDENDEVYMMWASRDLYNKLPGGGVDPGEDVETALARELLEELGCKAEIISEIGRIIEYRDEARLHQVSDCFLVRQVGDLVPFTLTEKEKAAGFSPIKVPNIDEAIKLMESKRQENYGGRFMALRDLTFLRAARELLSKT